MTATTFHIAAYATLQIFVPGKSGANIIAKDRRPSA